MQRTGHSRLLVTEGDHLLGIVSLNDLLKFLHLKLELGDDHRGGGEPDEPGGLAKDEEADRLQPQ